MASETLRLNAADVERLLGERSVVARETVARKVAGALDGENLGEAERNLAIDILHRMADDVAVTVRAALSESIATSPFLPRDLARKLANDVAQTALPILQFATILTDADLIAIIAGGDPLKQQAIARRPSVSEIVSERLIEQGDELSVSTLLANQGARIAEQSLERALDRFSTSVAVQESMARRAQLPLAVTERLITLVSEQFKHYLLANHKVSLSVATDTVIQSRERALMSLTEGVRAGPELERLARQLKDNGRLTPSLVLRALCLGDIVFFETGIAVLAEIPLSNARLLIHDAGPLGLKSLLERARLPPAILPAVRAALGVARDTPAEDVPGGLAAFRRRMIERVLTHVEAIDGEDAEYLLAKLSDLSGHAASLRQASAR